MKRFFLIASGYVRSRRLPEGSGTWRAGRGLDDLMITGFKGWLILQISWRSQNPCIFIYDFFWRFVNPIMS